MKPLIFGAGVNSPDSANKWRHWKRTFQSYLRRIEGATDKDKLDILISFVNTSVYVYVSECRTLDETITLLNSAHVKRVNDVFARHRLTLRCRNL